MTSKARSSWHIEPGAEVVPGRIARGLLGGGERCEAYAAFNERLFMSTVVKVVRPAFVEDARARRALGREGDVLAALDHPGLARLVDVDAGGERPYIEMEHVGGPRLSRLVRRHGPLDPERALALGRQLAATLDYLHGQGFLHLDVKPSNVIVGSVPRLIDLSVARRIDRAHRINGFVGTDAYMAPEQADPTRWSTIGPKTDAWGLGATVYYAVAGRRPFRRGERTATGEERFPQLIEAPAPPVALGDSRALVELIMRSLSPAPADRPSVRELHDGFDQLATSPELRHRRRR